MHGLINGNPQGLGMLYGTVQAQASLMAYNDIYRLLAVMAFPFIPSFLLLNRLNAGASAAAH